MYQKIIASALLMFAVINPITLMAQQTTEQREVSFYIKEMTCQLCVYLVNKELRALDGVIKTKANMNEHTVKIMAKPTVTNQQLINAIEKLHYTAKVIE